MYSSVHHHTLQRSRVRPTTLFAAGRIHSVFIQISQSSFSFPSPPPTDRATLSSYLISLATNPPFLYPPLLLPLEPSGAILLLKTSSFCVSVCAVECTCACVPDQSSLHRPCCPSLLLIVPPTNQSIKNNTTPTSPVILAQQPNNFTQVLSSATLLLCIPALQHCPDIWNQSLLPPVGRSIDTLRKEEHFYRRNKKKSNQDYIAIPGVSGQLNLYFSTPNSCTVFIFLRLQFLSYSVYIALHCIALLAPSHIPASILQPLICKTRRYPRTEHDKRERGIPGKSKRDSNPSID
ncbi:hypothetical protein F5Y03DRAFT_77704 [Xylaria venustula]|nr:hypothetical protein F5Y03DRAFT_77704 [Xylaria venustula]